MGRVSVGLIVRFGTLVGGGLMLAHCSQTPGGVDPKYGVSSSPRVVQLGEPVPKGGGAYRVGKPYTIGGRTYSPEENAGYSAQGIASWYGEDFHGRRTANGEVYDMASITAAHPTLPIPSYVRVTNLRNHRSLIVRVNDRGPYHQDRLIDVSVRAARLLGFFERGTTNVRVDYVGPASLTGSDDNKLEATLRHGGPAPGPAELRVASSRTVLPQFTETNRGQARGDVPTPASRPYELGQERPEPVSPRLARGSQPSEVAAVERRLIVPAAARPAPSRPAQAIASAGRPASPVASTSFDSRFGPAANMPPAPSQPETLSAFAPAGPARSDGAVLSGRGLY